jgi:uncharacterized protein YjbI with pentapeptide repeats
MYQTSFKGAKLERMVVADSYFADSDFTDAQIDCLVMYNCNLENALLYKTVCANSKLEEVNLSQSSLMHVEFDHVAFHYVQFDGSNWLKAQMSSSKLYACSFAESRFHHSNFVDTWATKTTLKNASVSGGKWSKCVLWKCGFNAASFQQTVFDQVEMRDCDFTNASVMHTVWETSHLENSL